VSGETLGKASARADRVGNILEHDFETQAVSPDAPSTSRLRKMGMPALTNVASCRVKTVRPLLLSARPKTRGRLFFAARAQGGGIAGEPARAGLHGRGRGAERKFWGGVRVFDNFFDRRVAVENCPKAIVAKRAHALSDALLTDLQRGRPLHDQVADAFRHAQPLVDPKRPLYPVWLQTPQPRPK